MPLAASPHGPGTPAESTSRSPGMLLACSTSTYSALIGTLPQKKHAPRAPRRRRPRPCLVPPRPRLWSRRRRRRALGPSPAQGFEPLRHARAHEPDAREIVPQRGVKVAPEAHPKHGVLATLHDLAAKLLDVLHFGFVETHRLVRLARELTVQEARRRLAGEVLGLAPLPLRQRFHLRRQAQHSKPHVARLVSQDATADLADERVLAAVRQHAKERDGKRLGDELRADG